MIRACLKVKGQCHVIRHSNPLSCSVSTTSKLEFLKHHTKGNTIQPFILLLPDDCTKWYKQRCISVIGCWYRGIWWRDCYSHYVNTNSIDSAFSASLSCWPHPAVTARGCSRSSAGCRPRTTRPRPRWRRFSKPWRSWRSTMTRRAWRWRRRAFRINCWLKSLRRKWWVWMGKRETE